MGVDEFEQRLVELRRVLPDAGVTAFGRPPLRPRDPLVQTPRQAHRDQEEQATVAALKAAVAQQQNEIKLLTASLKEQRMQLQELVGLTPAETSKTAVLEAAKIQR